MAAFLAFLGGLFRWAAPYLLAAGVGIAVYQTAPGVGVNAQRARLEKESTAWETKSADWQRSALGWQRSWSLSEGLRTEERKTAQAAANNLIQQCSARVEEARASARVIERIVTKEPTYDENRCPVRELVDAGSLRDALRPAAGADRPASTPRR